MATVWPSLLPALLIVAAYLGLGLPRLSNRLAALLTLCAAIVLLLLALQTVLLHPTAAMLAVTSLLAGHWGWWLGHGAKTHQQRDADDSELQPAASTTRRGAKNDATTQFGDEPAPVPEVTLRIPPAAMPQIPPRPFPTAARQAPLQVAAAPAPSLPGPSRGGVAISDLSRTSLGRYRIDRVIGRGSMGVVYLGLDPMLGRQVAIKTMALGREFDGSELDEVKQRFFREAETAGRLQHRDIVTIYDVGEEQDLAYIAMEFLKGQDLQRHTSGAKLLPVPVVLRVGVRVAEALAYAHTCGVIHRDVKPANVMLHLPTGSVKVTDFGIARVTDASRTRTGTVLGTPSFMSPEHLAGQRMDGRSDLYSLGVMLYQLFSGQLPFQADSMAKLMFRIANDVAPDIRSVRSDLPEALALVLSRALAKRPDQRHLDGAQMAAELRAIDLGSAGPLWAGPTDGAETSAEPAIESPNDAFAATVRHLR